jgi:hypothetical protein
MLWFVSWDSTEKRIGNHGENVPDCASLELNWCA